MKSLANPKYKPNMVFREIRDFEGSPIGWIQSSYDGTKEMAKEVAKQISQKMYEEFPDCSNVNSRIGATDEMANPKYTISPNFQHIADVSKETNEAKYIWGYTI